MTDRNRKKDDSPLDPFGWTRRGLLRRAGMLGVGALGAGVLGCKQRPEEDFVDLSTGPTLVQVGGTISGQVSGLLTGVAGADVRVRVVGFGSTRTDAGGSYSIRVDEPGDYELEINGPGFVPRLSRIRVSESAVVDLDLLERDGGLNLTFLDEFARGRGPGSKEGVEPRTPGRTNRWLAPPRVIIYRQLEDDDKRVIPDERLTAMQASILSLAGPLTGNALGVAGVGVRNEAPPRRVEGAEAGTIAIAQRTDNLLGAETVGSAASRYSIVKSRITCRVDSTIELFNRMFAHALGGQVVSPGYDSILSADGRDSPSARDELAATFLYGRVPGNQAPDEDPSDVFING